MTVSLEMKFFTCNKCGITWGVPKLLDGSGECPMCARRLIDDLHDRRWKATSRAIDAESKVKRLERALRRATA